MATNLKFNVAGVMHRIPEFQKAQVKNSDLLSLEMEPTNKYDPNAIKILKEGQHIGYIPKEYCAHLLLAMANKVELKVEVIAAWSKGCSVNVTGTHEV